jgi:hypothetical protein
MILPMTGSAGTSRSSYSELMSATQIKPSARERRISVIPRRCGPISGAQLVDRELLARVSTSDHALQRFGERAGLALSAREQLEPALRDLLEQEGLVVVKPPPWARLRTTSDYERSPLYLQAGFWMLFVARPDPRSGPSHWTITTAITQSPRWTWEAAVAGGKIGTPPPVASAPPMREQVSRRSSLAIAIGQTHSPLRLPAAVRAAHAAREQAAAARHALATETWRRDRECYERARERAHGRHLRRHGFVT